MKTKLCALWMVLVCLISNVAAAEDPTLQITFLNVGSADMCLLQTGHSTVVIDTGKNKAGEVLVEHLKQEGISKVDVLIITHFDKDHVGGADTLLSEIDVGQVIEPSYAKDDKQTTQYREAMAEQGITPLTLTQNHSFELDGVSYQIDVANQDYYGEDEENDLSLVTSVRFGGSSVLFAGDAEDPRLQELLLEGNLTHDILKVPHHGRAEDSSAAFFQAVGAKYAVITSDEKELEDASVVEYLLAIGTETFLTREGTVTCVLDSTGIAFAQEK